MIIYWFVQQPSLWRFTIYLVSFCAFSRWYFLRILDTILWWYLPKVFTMLALTSILVHALDRLVASTIWLHQMCVQNCALVFKSFAVLLQDISSLVCLFCGVRKWLFLFSRFDAVVIGAGGAGMRAALQISKPEASCGCFLKFSQLVLILYRRKVVSPLLLVMHANEDHWEQHVRYG